MSALSVQCGIDGCSRGANIGAVCCEIQARVSPIQHTGTGDDDFTGVLGGVEGEWWLSPRSVVLQTMHSMCVTELRVSILGPTFLLHFVARDQHKDGRGLRFIHDTVDAQVLHREMGKAGGPMSLVMSHASSGGVRRGRVIARKGVAGRLYVLHGCYNLYQAFVDLIDREIERLRASVKEE